MKKWIALILSGLLACSVTSCGKQEQPSVVVEPQLSQMKAICELGVMECYYHNVAKFYDEDASGILWWQKDKHFWIEYSGVVKVGVDVSRVSMDVDGDVITITLPPAKILNCTVDEASLNPDSYIVDKNSASITGADEVQALAEAQRQLQEAAAGDRVILSEAQDRVRQLLSDYVDNVVNRANQQYTIRWIYLDEEGRTSEKEPVETAAPTPVPTTA